MGQGIQSPEAPILILIGGVENVTLNLGGCACRRRLLAQSELGTAQNRQRFPIVVCHCRGVGAKPRLVDDWVHVVAPEPGSERSLSERSERIR